MVSADIEERLEAGLPLWLLSDLHANVEALDAVLAELGPDDPVVFLGDLLTYGCAPEALMERVGRELHERASALLWGNHDRLYRDLIDGDDSYYARLPDWLRETVDWNLERVDPAWFGDDFGWRWQVELSEVLIDHANPYPSGDWTYLNTLDEQRAALDTLGEQGYRLGVFGHTHRAKLLAVRHGDEVLVEEPLATAFCLTPEHAAVWNVGSLGQPRSLHPKSTVGCLRRIQEGHTLEHRCVQYDLGAHLEALTSSGLSGATTRKLASYFEG